MPPQHHLLPRRGSGSLENLRIQLLGEKLIRESLIDENALGKAPRRSAADQLTRVIPLPRFAILAKIPD